VTVVLSPEEVETFTAAGNTFRLLDDGTTTSGRIGIVECSLAPGWVGPPQHVHLRNDETWYVLSGAVRFTTGDDSFVATRGRLVTAPIGAPHTFANADADAPALLLCTITPADYVEYFRELARLRPGPDGRFDPADMRAMMQRYATTPARGEGLRTGPASRPVPTSRPAEARS
jgi:mannose-6-phosphate isomerase-like protein (cupin superfamily)